MIQIYPMTTKDIPGAVHCIQAAFADDPYSNWVFDRQNFNAKRNADSLTLRCHWGLRNALFEVAKDPTSDDPDKVLGIGMWLPPKPRDQPESWADWFEAWRFWFGQVYVNVTNLGRGGLDVKRYYIWKDAQASAQKELWTDKETPYFCNIVTVLPEAQGKGIGKLIFKSVTDKADAEGRRCYLEASPAKDNVKIYEKLGFHVAKEMTCDDNGVKCSLTCMFREPKTPQA